MSMTSVGDLPRSSRDSLTRELGCKYVCAMCSLPRAWVKQRRLSCEKSLNLSGQSSYRNQFFMLWQQILFFWNGCHATTVVREVS